LSEIVVESCPIKNENCEFRDPLLKELKTDLLEDKRPLEPGLSTFKEIEPGYSIFPVQTSGESGFFVSMRGIVTAPWSERMPSQTARCYRHVKDSGNIFAIFPQCAFLSIQASQTIAHVSVGLTHW
jgi:hypothetical protein